jgi:UDP-3-O-[3-hydroxymyristoyl] glucosamine N-acyltransferase
MSYTIATLAAEIGATIVRGDGSAPVTGVANLAEAGPQQLAPFLDVQYSAQLTATKAGAVLVKSEPQGVTVPAGAALLQSADPEMAFLKAITLFHPQMKEPAGIDARAIIEPGAEIGPGASIGAYAVIRAGSKLGARTVVHAHAIVGRRCKIGDDCIIYPRVVLYDGVILGNRVMVHAGTILGADGFGYRFRGGRHVKIPQVGTVEIGDDVEIGANACIDRGALGPTRIGEGSKIDNLVQIGHNVRIGKHCIICGQAALAGSSGMDDYAMIGGNVGLADHVFMGKGSRAGAKSGIGKDVPPGTEVWGMFAVERKAAFKSLAAYNKLPELVERVRALERELKELREKK